MTLFIVTGLARAVAAGVLAATAGAAPAGVIGGPQLAGTGVIVSYPAGRAPKLPGIKASAWVIADAGTGQVLAAKDPHGQFRPASTLKVLTAVALIPALNPASSVVASKLAASQTPNDIGLLAGRQYQVSELFTALLTISANDAAVALAEGTGSYARGISLINAEARHLQADDTVAADPNGLDAPGQHTSAYDLALIARQALTMPAFMKYDTVRGGLFPIKPHKSVGLWNQNGLLTDYRGGIGGKIGWTSAAGATYVGMARRNGVTLIVSLLHCPALTEIVSAEKLLDWGFAEDGKVKPVGTLVPPASADPAATAATAGASGNGNDAHGAHGAVPAGHSHASDASHSALTSPSVLVAVSFAGLVAVVAALGVARSRRRSPPQRLPIRAARGRRPARRARPPNPLPERRAGDSGLMTICTALRAGRRFAGQRIWAVYDPRAAAGEARAVAADDLGGLRGARRVGGGRDCVVCPLCPLGARGFHVRKGLCGGKGCRSGTFFDREHFINTLAFPGGAVATRGTRPRVSVAAGLPCGWGGGGGG